MSFWGSIFGSKGAIEKATDGLYHGIDKAVLTKEERLDHNANMLRLYEPFKLAQRVIAIPFCYAYAIAWLSAFFAGLCGVDIKNQLEMLVSPTGMPLIVAMIVGFYFAGGYVESKKGKK